MFNTEHLIILNIAKVHIMVYHIHFKDCIIIYDERQLETIML